MTLDRGSPVPLYEQLAGILRAKISAGEWRSSPLPSQMRLQEDYGVGRDAVKHAAALLESEGLVFTVPGRGTYVWRSVPGRRGSG